jgi:hypothetical protein
MRLHGMGPLLLISVALLGCVGDDSGDVVEVPRTGGSPTEPADVSRSPTPSQTTDPTVDVAWACDSHDPFDLVDAAIDGRVEDVRVLLRECVPSPEASRHDDIALGRAANSGAVPVVEHLLDAVAGPTFVDSAGSSVLHWAARWVHAEADPDPETDESKARIVRWLLDRGADVDGRAEGEHTPLHWAAFAGYERVAGELVAAGADVDAVNHAGATALMLAAGPGHRGVVEVLLDAGADPALRDDRDLAPADVAAEQGHSEIAELLRAGDG